MKHIQFLLLLSISLFIISCGDAENKADKNNSDKQTKATDSPDIKIESDTSQSGTTRGLDIGGEPDEILTNIDKHLVSKVTFTSAGAAGGTTNGMLTVENTLPDATFQKALVEVNLLLADGSIFRTDYYTVQNLEPSGKKSVKLPNTTRGNSLVAHIVKAKSMELTKGEMILVGSHYVPN